MFEANLLDIPLHSPATALFSFHREGGEALNRGSPSAGGQKSLGDEVSVVPISIVFPTLDRS